MKRISKPTNKTSPRDFGHGAPQGGQRYRHAHFHQGAAADGLAAGVAGGRRNGTQLDPHPSNLFGSVVVVPQVRQGQEDRATNRGTHLDVVDVYGTSTTGSVLLLTS